MRETRASLELDGAAAPRRLLTTHGGHPSPPLPFRLRARRPSLPLPGPDTEATNPAPSTQAAVVLRGSKHATTSCSREGGGHPVGPGPHSRPHVATMVATHLTPPVDGMVEASI
jgi:hypothetical protein